MPPPDPIPDLLKAVNDASGKTFALWITLLTVETYLAISIGTTTHVQLLLAGPIKLPLLDVNMPLFEFYEFAPPLFVVLHLYILMQLYLLSVTLRLFEQELQTPQLIGKDRERIRGQLEKFVFTQLLINPPNVVPMKYILLAVVWISFIVGPILLLLAFEIRFLPYHSIFATYVHRFVLVFDVVLILLIWPYAYRSKWLTDRPRWKRRLETARDGILCLSLFFISFILVTIPDEFLDSAKVKWLYLPKSEFRLSLLGARLVESDRDKLAKLDVTLSLKDRDLQYAFLRGADLRKVDLSEANMFGANLLGTNLSDANLVVTNLNNADLNEAVLTHASLFGVRLIGAQLKNAVLTEANLSIAELAEADLTEADLTGANLALSHLESTNLLDAKLIDTDLTGVTLASVKNLTQQQLDQACVSEANMAPGTAYYPLPQGLTFHSRICAKRSSTFR